jgi:alkanesulfonate monooxygenase
MTLAPSNAHRIPATASPEVEFVSQVNWNTSTELDTHPQRGLDRGYVRRYAAALEEGGFDYTLVPYFSSSPDSFVLASAIGAVTERLKTVVALRPNHTFPLVAAQRLATLDQLTEGRAVVHLISGGLDAEQRRQGDYLTKDRRYARTSEYIDLLRRSWTETAPFDHEGEFYRFEGFGPGFAPYAAPIPISIGGQSDEAFTVGAAKADWFTFNAGESLAQTRADIDRVNAIARAAGRPDPRIWVTFRPVIAPTAAQAWEKAYEYADRLAEGSKAFAKIWGGDKLPPVPESAGQRRARAYAQASERYDRALWTGFTRATGGFGAASAGLVGTPETVAAAILDYIDAGASVVSIKGYDTLNDVVDYGRHILPLVRQELAHRKATGQRGTLQVDHLGFSDSSVAAAADRAAETVGAGR